MVARASPVMVLVMVWTVIGGDAPITVQTMTNTPTPDVKATVEQIQRAEAAGVDAHVRIGWLRSVANIYHAFAVHSFADELAQAAKRDSAEYLLELLGPPPGFSACM